MAPSLATPISCGFPPAAEPTARILILGSMPGQRSLKQQQYYAHPHNLFWPIMGKLVGAAPTLAYPERLQRLCDAGIALWDVLQQCQRPGSLDSAIDAASAVPNDFNTFFFAHPHIRHILFNGAKAEQLFKRLVFPRLDAPQPLRCQRLPSTSPANAGMDAASKQAAWQNAIQHSLTAL